MDTPPSPSDAPQPGDPPKQWTVGQLRAELIGLPDHTPLVVDVAIDATGEIEGAEAALSIAGSAARIVILTLRDEPMRLHPWQLVRQELTLLGSRLTRAHFDDLIALVASGKAPLERLITHRYPFAEAPAAFQMACDRPPGVIKTIVLPQM